MTAIELAALNLLWILNKIDFCKNQFLMILQHRYRILQHRYRFFQAQ